MKNLKFKDKVLYKAPPVNNNDFAQKLFILAPLAGYTDLPFRKVVKKFGADLTVSEMISANALIHNSERTLKMIEKSSIESPYSVQLAGNSVKVMKEAVIILNDCPGIDCIDLNSGCPAPKIVNNNSGSALLKDLKLFQDLLYTIKRYSNKKYTSVKVRIGFDTKIPEEIAKACNDSGVDFVAVHGRTKIGGYKSVVDYDAIKIIKELVNIPVIANGDIKTLEDANNVINNTKADGVMIGRGAIGNPWIFYQLQNQQEIVSNEKKKEIILEHFNSMIEFYGDMGIQIFRKHLHTYSKGYENATTFRQTINQLSVKNKIIKEIESFF
jgi:tRNA-dihydrouridine synthase B